MKFYRSFTKYSDVTKLKLLRNKISQNPLTHIKHSGNSKDTSSNKSIQNIQVMYKFSVDAHNQLLRKTALIINYIKFVFGSRFYYELILFAEQYSFGK